MIYGRFGDPLTILRRGTLEDVKSFEGREPDQTDRDNVEIGSYVVIRYADNGKETLYSVAYLRADDGWAEISDALEGKN